MPMFKEGVSVLVPVLNDEERLPYFFSELGASDVLEVIVCDFGSRDESFALARQAGAHVFRANNDFSSAMNSAAKSARGNILWFLPPSCVPPEDGASWLQWSLPEHNAIGGYWRLRIAGKGLRGWGYRLRRWLQPWKKSQIKIEQGIFINQEDFFALGGFSPSSTPMLNLVEKMREHGRLIVMDTPITYYQQYQHSYTTTKT